MVNSMAIQYRLLTTIRRVAHGAVGAGRSPLWYRRAVKAYFRRRLFEPASQTVRVRNGQLTGVLKRGPFCERDIEFAEGRYEPEVTEALTRLVGSGAVVCDVGANAGYHTVLLSKLVGPTGRVHAFEPAPLTVRWLEQTVASNGLTNVDVHELAVSDQVEAAQMMCGEALDGFASLRRGGHGVASPDRTPQIVTVETTTFDAWADLAGLSRLDLIKIDIEGAEMLALSGMRQTIARYRPALVCEFWGQSSITAGLRLLESLGYRCETLESWSGRVAGREETVATIAAVT
jgi:FkbM family methyltransferase